MDATRKPTKSTNFWPLGLTKPEPTMREPAWDLGHLFICYICIAWDFVGLLTEGSGAVSDALACFGDPCPLTGFCLTLI